MSEPTENMPVLLPDETTISSGHLRGIQVGYYALCALERVYRDGDAVNNEYSNQSYLLRLIINSMKPAIDEI